MHTAPIGLSTTLEAETHVLLSDHQGHPSSLIVVVHVLPVHLTIPVAYAIQSIGIL